MMRCLLLVLAMLVVAWPPSVRAHALDPGFLDLTAAGGDTWRVFWKVPQSGGKPLGLAAILPANCSPAEPPGSPSFDGRAYVWQWLAICPGGIGGGEVEVKGLEMTRTDVLVRFELAPGATATQRLTATQTAFTVPAVAWAGGVFGTYAALGVSHILEGADHLLFVFALLLLIRDWRMLIGAVTSFTLAHSISLAAATLGWIVVPPPPVEAVIALSIMFLAAELIRPAGEGLRLTERFPWLVSFGFGLLHGLGFARALLDIGLPPGEVPLALLTFNIGVEIGQLMFIAAVLLVGWLLRRVFPSLVESALVRGRPGNLLLGYGIGSVSAMWFLTRLAAF